jgi:hypothetical protein
MSHHIRKFKIYYTAFKGTKYAKRSAVEPIIEARNISSAINKFDKIPFNNKSDIIAVEEV